MSNWYDDLGEPDHSYGTGAVTDYIVFSLGLRNDPKYPTYIKSNIMNGEHLFIYPTFKDDSVMYNQITFDLSSPLDTICKQIRESMNKLTVDNDIKDWLNE